MASGTQCAISLLLLLIPALPAQNLRTIEAQGRQRLASGAVARLDLQRQVRAGTEVSIHSTPALDPPPALTWDDDQSSLTLGLPTGTPAGEYELQVEWVNEAGRLSTRRFTLAVEELPRLEELSRPPVVLLNGLQLSLFSSCPVATGRPPSSGTFGNMQALIEESGTKVLFFDNCKECPNCTLERLGTQLGRFLRAWKLEDGTEVPAFDVVAHSMGGLIVRAYLAGKQESPGVFEPPVETKVRKFVSLSTPYFGAYKSVAIGRQTAQLRTGSRFLFDLGTWNLGRDDLRGVDAVAVAGNACGYYDQPHGSDGLVTLSSSSLAFARPDERTRIVPYQHTAFVPFASCDGKGDIAKINDAGHDSWRIISSFLGGTEEWRSIGTTPAEDPYLSRAGALMVALQDRQGLLFNNVRRARLDGEENLSGDGTVFHADYVEAGTHGIDFVTSGGRVSATLEMAPGAGSAVVLKFGPQVKAIEFGETLVLRGRELAGVTVSIDGQALEVMSSGDEQVVVVMPGIAPGYHVLTVSNSAGQHTAGFMRY